MTSVVEQQIAPARQGVQIACGLPHRAVSPAAGVEENGWAVARIRVVEPHSVADDRRHDEIMESADDDIDVAGHTSHADVHIPAARDREQEAGAVLIARTVPC